MAPRKKPVRRRRPAKSPVINLQAQEVAPDTPAGDALDAAKPETSENASHEPMASETKDDATDQTLEPDMAAPEPSENAAAQSKPDETSSEDGQVETTADVASAQLAAKPKSLWPRVAGLGGLVVIAALGGGWLFREYALDYFPTKRMAQVDNRSGANTILLQENANKLAGINDRLSGVERSHQQSLAAIAELTGQRNEAQTQLATALERFAVLEAALESRETDIANLRQALSDASAKAGDSVAASAQDELKLKELSQALAGLQTRLDAAEQGGATVGEGVEAQLSAIQKRHDSERAAMNETIAALRQEVTDLAGLSQSATPASELAASLSQVKSAIGQGLAYKQPLERFAALMPGAPGLEVLEPHAATGVPSAALLATSLQGLSAAFVPAQDSAAASRDGGGLGVLKTKLTSVVKIRKKGVSDWPAAINRAVGLAHENKLQEAIAVLSRDTEVVPDDLAAWIGEANKRIAVDAASAQLSAAVVARIGSDN